MLERIAQGERADGAFLTSAGVEQLISEGVLAAGSRVDLARSLVGLAVKSGAPKPDISTVEATIRTLKAARSIVYSRKGQSGIFFSGLIQRLGIADEINAKATIIEAGITGEVAAAGKVDLAVQQVSELMLVPGIDIVGALPDEIQDDLVFSGAVFAGAAHPEQTRSLIQAMADPARAALYTEKGLAALNRG
jgi:molybdate transport system substrate-binding protein